MIPKLIAAGAVIVAHVTFAEAAEAPVTEDSVLRLACTGTMTTEGQAAPPSRIIADGVVDLETMRVRGFGIGSVPITAMGESLISFGSSPLDKASRPQEIAGTFDRTSGNTRITVRSAKSPSPILIEMDLECEATPDFFSR